MALNLVHSLSPHIVVQPSQDVSSLLQSRSLPPLHVILQAFSPLSQVTTRTVSLTQVVHPSFPLRFSSLSDVEAATREDEEARASRTIDWIGGRISSRAASWVDENGPGFTKGEDRWWDDLSRCLEGDKMPVKDEMWSHPVALVLAVSTMAPNPLQALSALHARAIQFPAWVEPTMLRYSLIIHPEGSPLSIEETTALLTATKKQFGLHTHLLQLPFTQPLSSIAIPPSYPSLPSTSPSAPNTMDEQLNKALLLSDHDVQNFMRFVREFAVMSLIPWMERCVAEWNENYSSTRRLPSRLFSSTRRLFGTASNPSLSSSISGTATPTSPTTPSTPTTTQPASSFPQQQRRLAEFTTVLGDYKLAITLFESLRKETRNASGAEILPFLLSPSTTLGGYAASAMSAESSVSASAQLRALRYAVRWELGIRQFGRIGGERWLVWAAGVSEEPPAALLFARAAFLSLRKGSRRRAATWFVSAANRLEKGGIKPLTIYFLKKAHEAYSLEPERRLLSPSFYEIEGEGEGRGFSYISVGIMSHIEHSLGRLRYTTGDTEAAIRLFIGLLKDNQEQDVNGDIIEDTDKVFVDDFRVAFQHFISTSPDSKAPSNLGLPLKLSRPAQTRIRMSPFEESLDSGLSSGEQWEVLEDAWRAYWKGTGGRESLEVVGKAEVGELFWVDLVMQNPLTTELSLSDLTLEVEATSDNVTKSDLGIESLAEVRLYPKESRVVPISIKCHKPATLRITQTKYSFLSLLPISESLSTRGKRLNDTPSQRQGIFHGPDIFLQAQVRESATRLEATFTDPHEEIILGLGEWRTVSFRIRNCGKCPVGEVFVLPNLEGEVWVESATETSDFFSPSPDLPSVQTLMSPNSMAPTSPSRLSLGHIHSSEVINPGESVEVTLVLNGQTLGVRDLLLLFVYRENDSQTIFNTARARRSFEVIQILDVRATLRPSLSTSRAYNLNVEVENIASTTDLSITQITSISPTWQCTSLGESAQRRLSKIPYRQVARTFLAVDRGKDTPAASSTTDYLASRLQDILEGRAPKSSTPPSLDISFNHISQSSSRIDVSTPAMQYFLRTSRCQHLSRKIVQQFPYIPPTDYPSIFPLYTPRDLDLLFFWEIPSEERSGWYHHSGLTLGASHATLGDVIKDVEANVVSGKGRSMYAETTREKEALLEAVRNSEWNEEHDPLVVHTRAPDRVVHDFSTGPCTVPVTFTIRNYSSALEARYALRLQTGLWTCPPSPYLPPNFVGILNHRGTIEPLSNVTVQTNVWVQREGIYSLNGWRIWSDVGAEDGGAWMKKATFSQQRFGGEGPCVNVVDAQSTR